MPNGAALSHSLTLQVRYRDQIGMLGRVTSAIGRAGADIRGIDFVAATRREVTRDLTVNVKDADHGERVVHALRRLPSVRVLHVADRTMLLHSRGKIQITPRVPLSSHHDLLMVYTPGVARVSQAIQARRDRVFDLTIKSNAVAIVTDGSAVLGLGNIGPHAALPVMEGKSLLFREFGGVDAFPLCVVAHSPEEIVSLCKAIAPTFGGINLEDIAAPTCFEVQSRLRAELQIPVFHDDQDGTAAVVLGALTNALRVVRKDVRNIKVVISGAGAAGTACARMLLSAGAKSIIVCDTAGAIYNGRKKNMNSAKQWLASHTNATGFKGSLAAALAEADFLLGVSGPDILPARALKKMARKPIVFALANPIPEVAPEQAIRYAAVFATGRSDYPNQINNVLIFPGLFRGLLDCRARQVNDRIVKAAGRALASVLKPSELRPDYVVPSVFDRRVAPAVAEAVAHAAMASGLARTHLPRTCPRPAQQPSLRLSSAAPGVPAYLVRFHSSST